MPIPVEQRAVANVLLKPMEDRVPEHVRDKLQIKYKWEGNAVILFEFRPSWRDPDVWLEEPVAKFRYVQSRREWQLFYMARTLKWKAFPVRPTAKKFETLLAEVERDSTGLFWG